jgi:hypothetical protein
MSDGCSTPVADTFQQALTTAISFFSKPASASISESLITD